ncbi:VOC family protein [Labilibacter marinus]|uniref:VOC family protein n=1 Tax=Labilibacter marinus TaxID=1477105 RepID=UPI0008311389|nr:VOC family protein [Labilibacter marinus]
MRLEHIAFWVKDLELMRAFYCEYFGMTSNKRYHNPNKNFSSYFLTFPEGRARIEIMHQPELLELAENGITYFGLTHIAISVGSMAKVNELTQKLESENYKIIGKPRVTGDGYYESVILDPEGNYIEITE